MWGVVLEINLNPGRVPENAGDLASMYITICVAGDALLDKCGVTSGVHKKAASALLTLCIESAKYGAHSDTVRLVIRYTFLPVSRNVYLFGPGLSWRPCANGLHVS